MKLFAIRSAAALALLSLLTACGGSDHDAGTPVAQHTAPARAVMEAPAAADGLAAAPASLDANGQNPAPDCQPENCQGLRIIDGNAEAYRVDAMRRSAADAGSAV